MSRFEAVVFDFDGVLVESVNVKTQAFAALYASYGIPVVNRVVAFHLANGGLSRYEKFRYFHNELLGLPLSVEEENRLAAEFSARVEEAVVAAPWVGGAREFLIEYHARIPLYVASGTPQEELERILKKRQASHYFQAILGSPARKREMLRAILKMRNYQPGKVLMVGDSLQDMAGAQEAGTAFIGRQSALENVFPSGIQVIPDITVLPKFMHDADERAC